MSKKDIKIFVSHRIDLDSEVIDNPLYVNVRCGAVFDERDNISMLGDDTGDNISEKRNRYGELTVLYWAWKNQKADYYGECHYRRYLSFKKNINGKCDKDGLLIESYINQDICDKYNLNKEYMEKVIESYDVIVNDTYDYYNGAVSIYDSMIADKVNFLPECIDLFIDVVTYKYPELNKYMQQYLHGTKYRGFNCFIVKKDIFEEYMPKLFDVLFEVEDRIDFSALNLAQERMVGYFGECFWAIYCLYLKDRGVKICELPLVKFEKSKKIQIDEREESIPIVLASSNEYVPFLCTAITSILENADKNRNYDFVVLENHILEDNKTILREYVTRYRNAKIQFYDINIYFENKKLYIRDHISPMTYARLVIGDILKNARKAIYIDCDCIVKVDISKLYDIDIRGVFIAAVRDTVMMGLSNFQGNDKQNNYNKNIVGIKNKFDYFNGGVMLLNLVKFREMFSGEYLLGIATERDWMWFDQDVLNKVCAGNVKWLDQKWNVMTRPWLDETKLAEYLAPADVFRSYIEALKEPFILHYAGNFLPHLHPDVKRGECFWEYARRTPFYEKILLRMIVNVNNKDPYYSQIVKENIYDRFRFPFEVVPAGARIIIYGGGVVGKIFIEQLTRASYCSVVAICDQNPESTGILQMPVINPKQLAAIDKEKYDMVLIAIENMNVAISIKENLKIMGVDNVKWVNPCV